MDERRPLSFERQEFLAQDFSVLAFVRSRKHIPLEVLRQDLSTATRALRTELIDLINADYADFISLATTLVDVEDLLDGLQRPLESARAVVQVIPVYADS